MITETCALNTTSAWDVEVLMCDTSIDTVGGSRKDSSVGVDDGASLLNHFHGSQAAINFSHPVGIVDHQLHVRIHKKEVTPRKIGSPRQREGIIACLLPCFKGANRNRAGLVTLTKEIANEGNCVVRATRVEHNRTIDIVDDRVQHAQNARALVLHDAVVEKLHGGAPRGRS